MNDAFLSIISLMAIQSDYIENEKPWYKRSSTWAWITSGAMILAVVIVMVVEDAQEKKAKANKGPLRPWTEVLTPEEKHQFGLDKVIDEHPQVKVDPNGAQRFKEFIEKGGNADPALDHLNDVDYYDIIDQLGGEEGF